MSDHAAGSGMWSAAAAVLRGNDVGRYTVPSRALYPHQWNWDSALCALGWAELDPGRAWTELESLAGARDEAGMLPHIAFRAGRRQPGRDGPLFGRLALTRRAAYLPGAPWWGPRHGADGRAISGITQPPLAGTCLRLLFERAPDEPRARALLPLFDRWHSFLLGARDPHGLGEPVLIHPWESGRDNAPEWDAPLFRVRPRLAYVYRQDTRRVDAAERPSSAHYRRYLTLVVAGTDTGWQQERLAREGDFRVLDSAFSAILARACEDVAWLAAQLGERRLADASHERSERVASALRRRAGSDGLVPPVDLVSDAPLEARSAGLALTALAPQASPATIGAVARLVSGPLESCCGVRSLARGDEGWSPLNYWRGPVWANVTWLCAHGLELHGDRQRAEGLRSRMLEAVAGAGMREYFSPDSGRGLGARDFGWTAALTLRELGRLPG